MSSILRDALHCTISFSRLGGYSQGGDWQNGTEGVGGSITERRLKHSVSVWRLPWWNLFREHKLVQVMEATLGSISSVASQTQEKFSMREEVTMRVIILIL
jgi:hypothetical protein